MTVKCHGEAHQCAEGISVCASTVIHAFHVWTGGPVPDKTGSGSTDTREKSQVSLLVSSTVALKERRAMPRFIRSIDPRCDSIKSWIGRGVTRDRSKIHQKMVRVKLSTTVLTDLGLDRKVLGGSSPR